MMSGRPEEHGGLLFEHGDDARPTGVNPSPSPGSPRSIGPRPFLIEGDARWILAATEAEASEFAESMWPLDEVVIKADGWMQNVGWDRESYDLKREFVAATGLSSWWEGCLPPVDAEPRKNAMPAWRVEFA